MPHSREPYRELRRLELASRMIRLRMRTHAVCAWSGLSKPKVLSVFRAVRAQSGSGARRPHGPSPSSLGAFQESRRLRRESAALAGLCSLFGVVDTRGEEGWRPGVERGERLCQAYEAYLMFVSRPGLSLEHAVLLSGELAKGVEIALSHCSNCGCVRLLDRLDPQGHCAGCPA